MGVSVIDLGCVTTPQLHFQVGTPAVLATAMGCELPPIIHHCTTAPLHYCTTAPLQQEGPVN